MKSFVELIQYIFTVPGVKVFLSEKISQDPLEKFFGCQRQRGAVLLLIYVKSSIFVITMF